MSQTENTDSDGSEFHTCLSLINRVRDRTDVESWRAFYQYYQPLLTRYLRSQGLDEHAANDVTQDVFVRLLQSLPTFEFDSKRGRFRGYLWKLTYSALVDQARRLKSRRRAEENWIERFQDATEAEGRKVQQELDEINQQQILERAMSRVRSETSSKAWACFEQRLLRDRPGSVIAAELGISAKAVFVYASRVLKAVRTQCAALAEDLENEPIDWLPRRT
jgi:RNA polymerase sigma factor (sigma-70 family)